MQLNMLNCTLNPMQQGAAAGQQAAGPPVPICPIRLAQADKLVRTVVPHPSFSLTLFCVLPC